MRRCSHNLDLQIETAKHALWAEIQNMTTLESFIDRIKEYLPRIGVDQLIDFLISMNAGQALAALCDTLEANQDNSAIRRLSQRPISQLFNLFSPNTNRRYQITAPDCLSM